MNLQMIKTKAQYEQALQQLERLMLANPAAESSDADTLEILSVLIEKYEDEHVRLDPVDPVEAIKFRMDQQNLKNRDLVKYMGSASKVAEVLNHKRPLSLNMIRALHKGLGISYTALMNEPVPEELDIDWQKFPLKELVERSLIPVRNGLSEAKERTEENIRQFFGSRLATAQLAFRRATPTRAGREMNPYALAVWHELSLQAAEKIETQAAFDIEELNDDFFENVARLSMFDEGPRLAQEYLLRHGIRLVVVPHFSKTYLDGAAIRHEKGYPIVSLTLRHDRLDNFWFVLLHELAHVKKHLYNDSLTVIYDDLDVESSQQIETEADRLASDSLISPAQWRDIATLTTANEIRKAAKKCQRHPAILAGRLRKESNNYHWLNNLVGRGEVKKQLLLP